MEKIREELSCLDFFDASRIVAGTKRRIKFKNGVWFNVSPNFMPLVLADNGLRRDGASYWRPELEEQKEKCWSVEPEKPTEIRIGDGLLLKRSGDEYCFQIESSSGGGAVIDLRPEEYGPVRGEVLREWIEDRFQEAKDKPQKFKLVPVEDNA